MTEYNWFQLQEDMLDRHLREIARYHGINKPEVYEIESFEDLCDLEKNGRFSTDKEIGG